MPYININLSKRLDEADFEKIKTALGEAITILPGKSERVLMIDIEDGKRIYFGGIKKASAAYVDVKIYGSCDFYLKAQFTEAVFEILNKYAGVPADDAFISISEHDTWGLGGRLK